MLLMRRPATTRKCTTCGNPYLTPFSHREDTGICGTCTIYATRSPEHWWLEELQQLRRKRPRCKCAGKRYRAEKIQPGQTNTLPDYRCDTCAPILDRIHTLEEQIIRYRRQQADIDAYACQG